MMKRRKGGEREVGEEEEKDEEKRFKGGEKNVGVQRHKESKV